VIGAAVAAAIRGDLPVAFDTFMTAICGPNYPAVITAALGSADLAKARANCGYFFTGEAPAVGRWHFDDELAHRIRQPVHLVAGSESPPFTHHLIAHLAMTLPHADITIVPGQNHLLPLQAPEDLANLVAAVIDSEPALKSA